MASAAKAGQTPTETPAVPGQIDTAGSENLVTKAYPEDKPWGDVIFPWEGELFPWSEGDDFPRLADGTPDQELITEQNREALSQKWQHFAGKKQEFEDRNRFISLKEDYDKAYPAKKAGEILGDPPESLKGRREYQKKRLKLIKKYKDMMADGRMPEDYYSARDEEVVTGMNEDRENRASPHWLTKPGLSYLSDDASPTPLGLEGVTLPEAPAKEDGGGYSLIDTLIPTANASEAAHGADADAVSERDAEQLGSGNPELYSEEEYLQTEASPNPQGAFPDANHGEEYEDMMDVDPLRPVEEAIGEYPDDPRSTDPAKMAAHERYMAQANAYNRGEGMTPDEIKNSSPAELNSQQVNKVGESIGRGDRPFDYYMDTPGGRAALALNAREHGITGFESANDIATFINTGKLPDGTTAKTYADQQKAVTKSIKTAKDYALGSIKDILKGSGLIDSEKKQGQVFGKANNLFKTFGAKLGQQIYRYGVANDVYHQGQEGMNSAYLDAAK